ncbi:hypothetical protein EPUS_04308 [Endocarpon pusillum Z07020]|uniref:Uncharacterized protein n=1 Tax=Endocarpon pusillum (strain Z07020 / HMAS-L-300199) TaxID=1263415 RepID=U1GVX2_ENDPU|nr:uncharacterized protein EPUS_04308 [Endocarpon pusillum Z07020]ERF76231.1 hypothetical protein EPUS_04308 [Endocarpon pusillum Z07020]
MGPIRKVVQRTISSDSTATTRSGVKRRTTKSVGRGARRVPWCIPWPRAYTGSVAVPRRREGGRKKPSITNIAQWYLDRRYPSQGPTGLVYALQELPPSHSAQSVVDALNAALAALELEPSKTESYAVWDNPEELWGPHNTQICSSTLSTGLENTSTTTAPLLGLSTFPNTDASRPSQGKALFHESIVETKHLPQLPIFESGSATADDFLPSHPACPPNPFAPVFPVSTDLDVEPGLDHLSSVADSRYPPFRNDRTQSQPQVRRKVGMSDLKARAATLPQLSVNPPQRTPTCLRVGSPITGPVMTRKPLAKDSLKIRMPKDRNKENLPRSLQATDNGSALNPGPDAGKCVITAADAVKDECKSQLEPLDSDLGSFTCDFPPIGSRGPSRARSGVVRGGKFKESTVFPWETGCSSSDSASTSQTSIAQTNCYSCSSTKKHGSSRHVGTTKDVSPLSNPSEPMKAAHGDLENVAMSNATLKALLATEGDANHSRKEMEERIASKRLSEHSAAVIQGFRDFTHRSFFPSPEDVRSQSDGTLWPRAPSQNRAADLSGVQARAASETSLAIRKQKGRGIIFTDDGPWKVVR